MVVVQPPFRPGTSPTHLRRLGFLRRWANLLDSAFRVPGTRIRFGWDPIVGLLPVLGALVTPVFSILVMGHAFSVRVPASVQLRMLAHVLLDMAVSLVPVVGDLLDVFWKANTRNLALLERHAMEGVKPGVLDRIVAAAVIGVLVLVIVGPFVLIIWVLLVFGLV